MGRMPGVWDMSYLYGATAFRYGTRPYPNTDTTRLIRFVTKKTGEWETVPIDIVDTTGVFSSVSIANYGPTFLLLYVGAGEARIYRSADEGATWEEVLDHNITSLPYYGTLGLYHVMGRWCWMCHDGLGITPYLSADGVAWEPGERISGEDTWIASTQNWVSIDASERIHVCTSNSLGDPAVFYTRSLDGGMTWSEPVIVIAAPSAYLDRQAILAIGDTVLVLAADTEVDYGYGPLHQAISLDGGITWESNVVSFSPPHDYWYWLSLTACNYSLAVLPVGDDLYLYVDIDKEDEYPSPSPFLSYVLHSDNWKTGLPTWEIQYEAPQTVFQGAVDPCSAYPRDGAEGGGLFLGGPIQLVDDYYWEFARKGIFEIDPVAPDFDWAYQMINWDVLTAGDYTYAIWGSQEYRGDGSDFWFQFYLDAVRPSVYFF